MQQAFHLWFSIISKENFQTRRNKYFHLAISLITPTLFVILSQRTVNLNSDVTYFTLTASHSLNVFPTSFSQTREEKKNWGLRIEKEPRSRSRSSRSRSSRSRKANGVWNNAVTLRSPLYNSTPLEGVSNSNRAFSTTLCHHLFSSPFWYLRQNCKRQRLNLNYCHFWVLIGGKRMYVSFPLFQCHSLPFSTDLNRDVTPQNSAPRLLSVFLQEKVFRGQP